MSVNILRISGSAHKPVTNNKNLGKKSYDDVSVRSGKLSDHNNGPARTETSWLQVLCELF